MGINNEKLKELCNDIAINIKNTFKDKKINKNKINVINVFPIEGGYAIEITSKPYNTNIKRSGVIVYNGLAGYQRVKTNRQIDEEKYKKYVNNQVRSCINSAMYEWAIKNKIKTRRR